MCMKGRHFVRPLDNEERKTEYVDNTHCEYTSKYGERVMDLMVSFYKQLKLNLVISMVVLEQMAGYFLIVEVSVCTLKKK